MPATVPAPNPDSDRLTGARPRGRCPECGKDSALTPGGTVWPHGIPPGMAAVVEHDPRQYDCKGSRAKPMTAAQCERFDEWADAKLAELKAAWQQREQQREEAEFAEFVQLRWAFRHFDEEAFAACPWGSPRVAFIAIAADAAVTYACAVKPKRALLRSAHRILVAWPGEWSQDIFLLSDQEKADVLAKL